MPEPYTLDPAQQQDQNSSLPPAEPSVSPVATVQSTTATTEETTTNSPTSEPSTLAPNTETTPLGPVFSSTEAQQTPAIASNQTAVPSTNSGTQNAPTAMATTNMAAAMPAEAPEDAGKQKVLIVEDERPLAHALELKLNHSGMKAVAVNRSEDALVQIENMKFDIILLDLILPGMDGFELLKEIRAKDESVKIVILSNLGQPEDRERITPYNVSEYYVKSNMPLAAVVESIRSLV